MSCFLTFLWKKKKQEDNKLKVLKCTQPRLYYPSVTSSKKNTTIYIKKLNEILHYRMLLPHTLNTLATLFYLSCGIYIWTYTHNFTIVFYTHIPHTHSHTYTTYTNAPVSIGRVWICCKCKYEYMYFGLWLKYTSEYPCCQLWESVPLKDVFFLWFLHYFSFSKTFVRVHMFCCCYFLCAWSSVFKLQFCQNQNEL